jgi:membrane fusion protein, copper/silver efflux system
MNRNSLNLIYAAGLLAAGLFLGWLFFSGSSHNEHELHGADTHNHELTNGQSQEIWTCSMHPSVREEGPGRCPICGMDLIPASVEDREDDYSMVMTASAMKLADIQTTPVVRGFPEREIRLPGRIRVDERRVTGITTHFPGRVIDTKVNFTGAPIRKGEPMATIYSPDLITAQRELLEAYRHRLRNPRLYESSRRKFRLWEFTDDQIDAIIERGTVQREMEILSPVDGYVMARNIVDQQYVSEGTVIYEVANLESIWVVLEAYEEDMEWISPGQEMRFASRGNPGHIHTAVVNYIDPVVDSASRTVGIRADVRNNDNRLKPEMLVTGTIRSEMSEEKLLVPVSSVLWTGPRSLVYVKDTGADTPRFEVREVKLGPRSGDYYVIEEGVEEGEQVVFHGAFRIDSEFQLADRFSMMNREPGRGVVPAHDHGDRADRPVRDSDPHAGHTAPADEPHEHGHAIEGATDDFREDFPALLEHYLEGKDALIESDFESVRTAIQRMNNELESIGMHRMQGDAHMKWMEQYEAIGGHLGHILEAGETGEQREGFAQLSLVLIEVVHNYEIPGVVYHQYCPMEDASWLSTEEQIANPYDPEAMLRCGEVIERIEH